MLKKARRGQSVSGRFGSSSDIRSCEHSALFDLESWGRERAGNSVVFRAPLSRGDHVCDAWG